MRPNILPLIALAFACTVEEEPAPSKFLDADNDGFTEADDCDDNNPAIHPDAVEMCDGVDNDCSGVADDGQPFDAPTWFLDSDGDGYGSLESTTKACNQPSGYVDNPLDCNDTTAQAYPFATEVCDEIDNDCDGTIDESSAVDASTWYADSDGDGYGTEFAIAYGCAQPEGYTDNILDCNDTDATVNPDGTEVCKGHYDEDCDGLFEHEDPDIYEAADPTIYGAEFYYIDADGDGYGDEDTDPEVLCELASGFVEIRGDCDDTEDFVNPGQAETCGNGIDDNCDGDIDEETAPFQLRWYLDADGDGYGDAANPGPTQCAQPAGYASNSTDCNDNEKQINPGEKESYYDGVDRNCDGLSDYDADEDGYDSDAWGGEDCDDTDEFSNPGLVEVCGDGADNDCDGLADPCEVAATISGAAAGDHLGVAVTGTGDWDGDGMADLLVGADRYDAGGTAKGGVWLLLGPISGDHTVTDRDAAEFTGVTDQDLAGGSLAWVGDMDASGFDTIAVGAVGVDSGGIEAGAVYLLSGDATTSTALSGAKAKLVGEVAYDEAGSSLSKAGDFNDDGYADLLIGATGFDAVGTSSGAAYVVHGPVTADMDLSYADLRLGGAKSGEEAGTSVAGGQDLDGDGADDVAVGAPYTLKSGKYLGAAYVVRGPVEDNSMGLADADAIFYGEAAGDLAGTSIAMTGDVTGDGYADLIVGAPGNDVGGSKAGAVYVVSGDLATGGSQDLGDAVAMIHGISEDDWVGSAVSWVGDVDGDGTEDFLFAARYIDTDVSNAGAAFVVLGPISGSYDITRADVQISGVSAGDEAGASIGPAGDLDGDGTNDILVGAPYSDVTDKDAGGVMLVLGGGW